MTQKAAIKELIDYLKLYGRAQVPSSGSNVVVEFSRAADQLSFETLVYQGENYIPPSVRLCLSPSFRGPASNLKSTLSIDENSYSVSLHYQENTPLLTQDILMSLLEEFSWLSEEWRRVFDDHDKRDLVHVRVK